MFGLDHLAGMIVMALSRRTMRFTLNLNFYLINQQKYADENNLAN